MFGLLVQVNSFQKISFAHHFIKEFLKIIDLYSVHENVPFRKDFNPEMKL